MGRNGTPGTRIREVDEEAMAWTATTEFDAGPAWPPLPPGPLSAWTPRVQLLLSTAGDRFRVIPFEYSSGSFPDLDLDDWIVIDSDDQNREGRLGDEVIPAARMYGQASDPAERTLYLGTNVRKSDNNRSPWLIAWGPDDRRARTVGQPWATAARDRWRPFGVPGDIPPPVVIQTLMLGADGRIYGGGGAGEPLVFSYNPQPGAPDSGTFVYYGSVVPFQTAKKDDLVDHIAADGKTVLAVIRSQPTTLFWYDQRSPVGQPNGWRTLPLPTDIGTITYVLPVQFNASHPRGDGPPQPVEPLFVRISVRTDDQNEILYRYYRVHRDDADQVDLVRETGTVASNSWQAAAGPDPYFCIDPTVRRRPEGPRVGVSVYHRGQLLSAPWQLTVYASRFHRLAVVTSPRGGGEAIVGGTREYGDFVLYDPSAPPEERVNRIYQQVDPVADQEIRLDVYGMLATADGVYCAGYPNGSLFLVKPGQPSTAAPCRCSPPPGSDSANPRLVLVTERDVRGASDLDYGSFLATDRGGRLYMAAHPRKSIAVGLVIDAAGVDNQHKSTARFVTLPGYVDVGLAGTGDGDWIVCSVAGSEGRPHGLFTFPAAEYVRGSDRVPGLTFHELQLGPDAAEHGVRHSGPIAAAGGPVVVGVAPGERWFWLYRFDAATGSVSTPQLVLLERRFPCTGFCFADQLYPGTDYWFWTYVTLTATLQTYLIRFRPDPGGQGNWGAWQGEIFTDPDLRDVTDLAFVGNDLYLAGRAPLRVWEGILPRESPS